VNLLSRLPNIPIRTLDALHLIIAKELPADIIVTADTVMAAAAKVMGFTVTAF